MLGGQLENTNGIRERKRKRNVRAHAHDLNEWAGQPMLKYSLCGFMHTVVAKETDRTDQHKQ